MYFKRYRFYFILLLYLKMVILNKKEYLDDFFKVIPHPVYFNLKIYNTDELEKEAGYWWTWYIKKFINKKRNQ